MNRSQKDNPNLHLGENTIESLKQAGSHGAEYVEFGMTFESFPSFVLKDVDVQLTKDGVPVLYHDCKMIFKALKGMH